MVLTPVKSGFDQVRRFFARRGYRGEVWTTVHSIQVIENEGHIEMRVEQVYRQSLQMDHFVANRFRIPRSTQTSGNSTRRSFRNTSMADFTFAGVGQKNSQIRPAVRFGFKSTET